MASDYPFWQAIYPFWQAIIRFGKRKYDHNNLPIFLDTAPKITVSKKIGTGYYDVLRIDFSKYFLLKVGQKIPTDTHPKSMCVNSKTPARFLGLDFQKSFILYILEDKIYNMNDFPKSLIKKF